MELASVAGGLIGTPAFVGFGTSAPGLSVLGTTINLTGTLAPLSLNYAFTVPRSGTLTSLSAFFSATLAVGVGIGNYTVHAALYRSPAPATNVFTAISGADLALAPAFPGLGISLGDIARGSLSMNIPVSVGDRLLLVFYVQPPTLSVAASLTGYASAGLSIV